LITDRATVFTPGEGQGRKLNVPESGVALGLVTARLFLFKVLTAPFALTHFAAVIE